MNENDMMKERENGKESAKNSLARRKNNPAGRFPSVSRMTLGVGVLGALAIGLSSPTVGLVAIGAAAISAAGSALAENALRDDTQHNDDT